MVKFTVKNRDICNFKVNIPSKKNNYVTEMKKTISKNKKRKRSSEVEWVYKRLGWI